MSDQLRLLINKNFTGIAAVIESLATRHHDPTHPLLLHVSHTKQQHASMEQARRDNIPYWQEPSGLKGEEYVDYLLNRCQWYNLNAVLVGKERETLQQEKTQELFRSEGIQLITTTDISNEKLLSHKAVFMDNYHGELGIPKFETFHNLGEFEIAYKKLKTPQNTLCVKPNVGIFASGFRRIIEKPDPNSFLSGELYEMTLNAYRELLGTKETWPEMLIMTFLPGDECSVDAVAYRGNLLGSVIRRKHREEQWIVRDERLEREAARIAQNYQLHGFFNFQTREDEHGNPKVLEINTRQSGNIGHALASGLNLAGLLIDKLSDLPITGTQTPQAPQIIRSLQCAYSAVPDEDTLPS